MLAEFLLVFIPIFVAVDPIGVLPIFVSLTEGLRPDKKKKILWQSIVTATALAIGFIYLGKAIFRFLGISMGDFMVAGGAILFCIAIVDLISSDKQPKLSDENLGVVPIGTPLIVGPGVMTTSLILIDQRGVMLTLAAVLVNILIVGVVFLFSDKILKWLGESGAKAISKVVTLLLAAIAVMMIRKGIVELIGVSAASPLGAG